MQKKENNVVKTNVKLCKDDLPSPPHPTHPPDIFPKHPILQGKSDER